MFAGVVAAESFAAAVVSVAEAGVAARERLAQLGDAVGEPLEVLAPGLRFGRRQDNLPGPGGRELGPQLGNRLSGADALGLDRRDLGLGPRAEAPAVEQPRKL